MIECTSGSLLLPMVKAFEVLPVTGKLVIKLIVFILPPQKIFQEYALCGRYKLLNRVTLRRKFAGNSSRTVWRCSPFEGLPSFMRYHKIKTEFDILATFCHTIPLTGRNSDVRFLCMTGTIYKQRNEQDKRLNKKLAGRRDGGSRTGHFFTNRALHRSIGRSIYITARTDNTRVNAIPTDALKAPNPVQAPKIGIWIIKIG